MSQSESNVQQQVALFVWRKHEIKCPKCGKTSEFIVFEAWLENKFCSECKANLITEEVRAKELAKHMDVETALLLRGLVTVYAKNEMHDTRQVVLDANCALELNLKSKIINHLNARKVDVDIIEFLLDNFKFIDQKTKLIKALKFEKPEDVEKKIKKIRELRNKVAHNGYTPTTKEATDCFTMIHQIISVVKPPPITIVERIIQRNKYSEALSRALQEPVNKQSIMT